MYATVVWNARSKNVEIDEGYDRGEKMLPKRVQKKA